MLIQYVNGLGMLSRVKHLLIQYQYLNCTWLFFRGQDIEFDTNVFVSGVYFCDITIEEVFVVPVPPVDVIVASLVFDVVATTDKMFIIALKNVLRYLKVKIILQFS